MNPLPFAPEDLIELFDRYPVAVAEPFDTDHLRLGTVLAPYYSRRYVFDFKGGERLVLVVHHAQSTG